MTQRKRRWRIDFTSIVGVPVALGLVVIGQILEGGTLRSLLQLAASLIVFGGTLGAVLLSFSFHDVKLAVRSLRTVFFYAGEPPVRTIERVLGYAAVARKQGILGLEDDLTQEPDAFLRKGLGLAVDGASPHAVRDLMEIEMRAREEQEERPARVYESAGGYAPTLGILGAVLGLIHVMENLSDPDRLGAGIAVAFVATVYGVGSANLVFLPIATRLRNRARLAAEHRELLLEGILAIQEGLNPRLIEQKLEGYIDESHGAIQIPGHRAA